MTFIQTVSAIVVGSFLTASLPSTVWAGEEGDARSRGLRRAVDRAASRFVAEQPSVTNAASSARQAVGAGGGSGVMIWTLVGTLASVATTYFVIKEVRKQTDKVSEQIQTQVP